MPPGIRLITPGLGVAEQRLDELCGIASVMTRSPGRAGPQCGWDVPTAISPALAIRFTLLMTVIPDGWLR